MDAFASENLILLVAATIIINRGFEKTRLRLVRPAYVVVQGFDLAMLGLLSIARLQELPTKPDFVIRIFLMLFVTYHMVLNSQARARALRDEGEAETDRIRAREERRQRQARAAAADAELQMEAADAELQMEAAASAVGSATDVDPV